MRLLASADHHLDEDSPRWEECQRVHNWMVDVAREEHVDLFASAGDMYERASTPLERQFAADWKIRMAEVCAIAFAKGNHDRSLDCEILSRLQSKHPIHVEERAGVVVTGGAAIAMMAWPERSSLLAELGNSEATSAALRAAMQNVLRGLGQQLNQYDLPRILLGHFMVDGAVTSTGQPLLGMPINVSLSDLALARAHLGIMGHIHKAQVFDVGGNPHHYTGSPFRTDYGQTENKTVLLAQFDGPGLKWVREIETPCSRMVHLDYNWSPEGFFVVDGHQVTEADWPSMFNAEVRLRYHVAPDQREAAERAAHETEDNIRAKGAVLVKLDPVLIQTHRARAPEVAAATGIVEKLEAHWRSISFDPGDRRGSLLRKAVQLEEQVRAQ